MPQMKVFFMKYYTACKNYKNQATAKSNQRMPNCK